MDLERRRLLATAALLPVAAAVRAANEEYPDKPVRLVVPFPPGGGADNLARAIMPKVVHALGKPIIIDNKPGAGGNVGAEIVAGSPPDGYTLLYGTNGTHSINQALYRNLRFDPVRDFTPVSRMTEIAAMLVVNPQMPVMTTTQLIRYAKANPGKVNFASAGNGTTSHLSGELFKTMAGIDIVHIPYRGGAAAVADLVSGQVQMMIDVMPNVYPLAKDGRIRGIAVSTAVRSPAAPEMPTISESGLAGFESSAWDGVLAPVGTPEAIVNKLNAAFNQALDSPETEKRLLAQGIEIPAKDRRSPAYASRFVQSEIKKYEGPIRASGIVIE